MRQNYSKASSIVVIAFIYLVAIGGGILTFARALDYMPEIWALMVADIAATIFVWAIGLAYDNVSVYDPYWSVIPPVLFTFWAVFKGCFSLPVILLLVAIWYWGIRLTANWLYTFKGIGYEDWRYTRYRETLSPFLFHVTNFFGLNMMPTMLVFACMLPGLGIYEGTASANVLTWLGCATCLAAASIEIAADTQIHQFRKEHPGQYCNVGLWNHGRHPNYFGEILFWWGIWIMYASLHGIDWLVLPPVAMTCLFLFISIPMMENRQIANKPGYAEYKKKTRLLI